MKSGVPQDSDFGPLLFSDLPLHIKNSDIDIFADDATLQESSYPRFIEPGSTI